MGLSSLTTIGELSDRRGGEKKKRCQSSVTWGRKGKEKISSVLSKGKHPRPRESVKKNGEQGPPKSSICLRRRRNIFARGRRGKATRSSGAGRPTGRKGGKEEKGVRTRREKAPAGRAQNLDEEGSWCKKKGNEGGGGEKGEGLAILEKRRGKKKIYFPPSLASPGRKPSSNTEKGEKGEEKKKAATPYQVKLVQHIGLNVQGKKGGEGVILP